MKRILLCLALLSAPVAAQKATVSALPGKTGPQGPAGPTGPASTAPGPAGPQGPRGDTGAQGVAGVAGAAGAQGAAGAAGATGSKGDTGATGASGVKGDTGSTGPAGSIGPQGPIGPTGAQGLAGFGAVTPIVPTRALNTAFQPSSTKATFACYYVALSVTNPLLIGSSTAQVQLLSDAAATPTTIRSIGSAGSAVGITVSLQLTTSNTLPLCYIVPAGHYVRLVSTVTGTGSASMAAQTEETLG